MKYTWPKFKLCRRDWINLFGPDKYDVRQRRKLPGANPNTMARLSEFGKLLRNKQILKRMYLMTESQFKKLVMEHAYKYSKNKNVKHNDAVLQFLERRLDSVILKAGLAATIMQARQIVSHAHLTVNGKKHNIASYYVQAWDVIEVKEKVKSSPLYTNAPCTQNGFKLPTWLTVDKTALKIQVLDLPKIEELQVPADVLKVVEFYARA